LKDMYKLLCLHNKNEKKEGEWNIHKKKRKERFCFQNLTNNQNEAIKLGKHWQLSQLNTWLSIFITK
jgi:hypothetical protein